MATVILVVIICLAFWMWPRHLHFSYHAASCVNQLTVAPGLIKSTSHEGFRAVAGGELKVNGVSLLATKTCILPVKAPEQGNYSVAIAPFGWSFGQQRLAITVDKPPIASMQPLREQVPVALPLKLPLSTQDEVFSYKLSAADKRLNCQTNDRSIICDLKKLGLEQGKKYEFVLERYFANKKVKIIAKKSVETLRATNVVNTSLKPGERVFSKPTSIQLELDKPIVSAEAQLIKAGDNAETTPVDVKAQGKLVDVSWEGELPRQTSYELTLTKVVAQDGSTLVAPFKLPFQLSGGPKVTNINVGRIKVAQSTTVTVSFDQELSSKQDLNKAIKTSGGAVIKGIQGNQVHFSVANVPRCGDFSIKINDELLSSYDIKGGSSWQFNARTICHSVESIGNSVRGRSILAYHFGSGPKVVLYTGAIHGSEPSSRSLMLRWIDELEANAQAIPADKTVIIVPSINPDGIAAGTRTNANNVDLNRNFGTSDWRKDITTTSNAPFPGGGGPSPMSEPETRVIAGFVARVRPQLVLSYHSIGDLAISNQYGIGNARAATYAALSGYRNATGQSSTTFDYSISGTADDYYAEKLGVAAVLIELGSHTYHQFERNQKAMWAMLKS